MLKVRIFNNKLSKLYRINYLILMSFIIVFALIGYGRLSKYENESVVNILPFKEGELPDPVVNINVTGIEALWNSLKYELDTYDIYPDITFSIEDINPLTQEEIYYHYEMATDEYALTSEQLATMPISWIPYTSSVQILEEGSYVIYVKIIDEEDVITYINTDLIVLDTDPSVTTSLDDNTWTSLRSSLDYVYIDREKNVTAAADDSSGIASIKYYMTKDTTGVLSATALNGLNSEMWNDYTNPISINELGTYVIYIKATDNHNHVTYVNTDYIVLNGYAQTLTIGRNSTSYLEDTPHITNKSVVTLNFKYTSESIELVDHTHNLMSNKLLPIGTKITLIDNVKDKVYEYQLTTEANSFPLTLFKEIGKGNEILFVEDTYYNDGTINEDFTVVVDFYNTNIDVNYNDVTLYMELHDGSDINVRPTLYSTIESFNVYSKVDDEAVSASLSLSTDYSGNEIIFNSDSSTSIDITSGINYKYIGETKIIDTTYEDKIMGLAVKMVDSEGNIVAREYLKSVIFRVGDDIYYPEEDNIIRINLKNGIDDVTKKLTIITCQNNGYLKEGTYYFKINNYVSDDGHYYDELGDIELSIPVNVVNDNSNIIYSFGVLMNDANRIITKAVGEVNVSFNILYSSSLEEPHIIENPNIRVSLFEKDELTAYNQNYSLVDLNDYVVDELEMYEENIYYVTTEPIEYGEPEYLYNSFELNLITSNFENNGYKLVFDLYDDTKKIGTIEKYFIVKEE